MATARSRTLAGIMGTAASAALLLTTLTGYEGKRNVGYLDLVKVPTACMGDTKAAPRGRACALPARAFVTVRAWAWLAVAVLTIALVAVIYHAGSRSNSAKVEARVERQHTAAVAEVRADERAAAATTVAIGTSTARQAAAVDDYVLTSIREMRDALDALPRATESAAPPAAPVDGVRDHLNTGLARAERAADTADAQP